MSEYVIDIGVEVEDTYINNDVEWMAKIVDAAHKHNTVTIKIYEPVAIEELNYKGKKILQILAEVCEQNNWQKDKFRFEIQNLIQDMSVWPNIQVPYNNTVFLNNIQEDKKVEEPKQFKKLFGVLVNRSSWDRLMISSYLFKKHKEKTFQKYCNDLNNPMHMINFDLDRLLWETSKSSELSGELLEQITKFMKELPMGDHVYDILNGDEDKIVEHATSTSVTSYYNKDWGFCLSENQKNKLPEGKYKAYIDSKFKKSHLDIAEAVVSGKNKKEIFFSSYICHPSMANNELSGPVLLNALLLYLKKKL